MTPEWEAAVRGGAVADLERLWKAGADIDARDRRGQTAIMIAAADGRADVIRWLVDRGAALDHAAKYRLTALMLAVVRGHVDAVRALAAAGADLTLRGAGAPGFADKTALDLAIAREHSEMVAILRSASDSPTSAPNNPHFAIAPSWHAASRMLVFQPVVPRDTAGHSLEGLRIHVLDHKKREVSIADRTLEAHYGRFVLSQSRKGVDEARRLALDVSYGRAASDVRIGSRPGRAYALGPEPEPDDVDGRSPSVVTWHDEEMFFLIASGELTVDVLVRIARSIYVSNQRKTEAQGTV